MAARGRGRGGPGARPGAKAASGDPAPRSPPNWAIPAEATGRATLAARVDHCCVVRWNPSSRSPPSPARALREGNRVTPRALCREDPAVLRATTQSSSEHGCCSEDTDDLPLTTSTSSGHSAPTALPDPARTRSDAVGPEGLGPAPGSGRAPSALAWSPAASFSATTSRFRRRAGAKSSMSGSDGPGTHVGSSYDLLACVFAHRIIRSRGTIATPTPSIGAIDRRHRTAPSIGAIERAPLSPGVAEAAAGGLISRPRAACCGRCSQERAGRSACASRGTR